MRESPFCKSFQKINKIFKLLRSKGLQNLEIPSLIVAGNEKSGKTSIIEQLLGLQILPKNRYNKQIIEIYFYFQQNIKQPQAKIDGLKDEYENIRTIQNLQQVKNYFDSLPKHRSYDEKNTVILRIKTNFMPNFKIIDLCGYSKIKLNNQETISQERFIEILSKPNSITLGVIAANTFEGNDVFKMIRNIDSSSSNSIICITKIDIMDKEKNVLQLLQNTFIPLKYGYTGVKCRSQHQINSQNTWKQILLEQKQYFQNHLLYKNVNKQAKGTQSLADKIVFLLLRKISSQIVNWIKSNKFDNSNEKIIQQLKHYEEIQNKLSQNKISKDEIKYSKGWNRLFGLEKQEQNKIIHNNPFIEKPKAQIKQTKTTPISKGPTNSQEMQAIQRKIILFSKLFGVNAL